MTNKMKDVVRVLGIEPNEEFKIEGLKEDYRFTENSIADFA